MAPQNDTQTRFEDAARFNAPKNLQEVARLLDMSESGDAGGGGGGGGGVTIDIDYCRWGGGFGTPLMQAISSGHVEMAQLLLDRGADCNARYREGRHFNRSVVHVAMSSGLHVSWTRFAEMLALKGVDVDVLDSTGSNLLHYILAGPQEHVGRVGKLAWVLANSKDRATLLSERNTHHSNTPRDLAVTRGAYDAVGLL